MPPGSSPISRFLPALLTVGLALACIVFTVRGPAAAVQPGGNYDFTLIYSSARAWVQGLNPYASADVSRAWLSSGGPAELDPTLVRGDATLVYPLPALVILSPIAALPWSLATWAWALLNTTLTALALTALARHIRLSPNAHRLFLTLGLLLSPLALNAKQGQTAVVVLACIVFASVLLRRSLASGILLGLGAALKPQLGLLFLIYHAGRLRWKHAAFAIAAVAVLTTIGATRSAIANVDWYPSWRSNIQAFTTIDDANATRTNPIRYQMINLHYPIHNFTDNRDAVRFAVFGIAAALCLAYFLVDLKRRSQTTDQPGELPSLSFVSAITLLVAYHRPYDAAVLIFPLALALHRLALRPPAHPRPPFHFFTLALVLLHALPLPILFTELARRGHIPQSILDSAIGRHILLPCQAWGLLVLALWLIYVRWKDPLTQRST